MEPSQPKRVRGKNRRKKSTMNYSSVNNSSGNSYFFFPSSGIGEQSLLLFIFRWLEVNVALSFCHLPSVCCSSCVLRPCPLWHIMFRLSFACHSYLFVLLHTICFPFIDSLCFEHIYINIYTIYMYLQVLQVNAALELWIAVSNCWAIESFTKLPKLKKFFSLFTGACLA